MTTLPLNLIIEGLVAVLLIMTIGYCILLNKRLKRLRADEEALRATIAELLTATEIAERAIGGLRDNAAQSEATLGQHIAHATHMSDELSTKMVAAEAIVQRIGKLAAATKTAKPAVAQTAETTGPAARPAVQGVVQGEGSPAAASRRLDDAARVLQQRLQRVAG
ncbi:MAG: chemotaxis protein [Devosiaceae bacterium]|nr:chemotaxis protein [Devosiaceae bacterium MH13]